MRFGVALSADSLTVRVAITFSKRGVFLTWDAFNALKDPARASATPDEFLRPEQRPIPVRTPPSRPPLATI